MPGWCRVYLHRMRGRTYDSLVDGVRDASPTGEIDKRAGTVEVPRVELIWAQMDQRLWTIEKLAEMAELSRSTLNGWPRRGAVRAHRRTLDKIAAAFERHPVRPMVVEWLSPGDA